MIDTKSFRYGETVFKYALDVDGFVRRVAQANKKALRAAAVVVRSEARKLVGRKGSRGKHSKAGDPPFRYTGNLRRSIAVQIGRTSAWIGATRPKGAHGRLLTHGRSRGSKRGEMKPRPFARTALENVQNRLPRKWQNTF